MKAIEKKNSNALIKKTFLQQKDCLLKKRKYYIIIKNFIELQTPNYFEKKKMKNICN